MEREDRPAADRFGTLLRDTDGAIAVFDRKGEVALLERSPHALALGRGHPTVEDEALGAAAQP